MKKASLQKTMIGAGKQLAMVVTTLIVLASCASKSSTTPDASKLADADVFDGLQEQPQKVGSVESSDNKLTPAEDAMTVDNKFADDNIVRPNKNGSADIKYDYYYTAVGGEKISRVAYALYNDRKAKKEIYKLNPSIKGMPDLAAATKVYFDMKKASPRAEYLTKDMIDRYKAELRTKLHERRSSVDGNASLAQTSVNKGETLQMISQRIYGTTRLWTELFLINQEKIGNFDHLKSGTLIDYYPVSDFMPAHTVAKTESFHASPAESEMIAEVQAPAPSAEAPSLPKNTKTGHGKAKASSPKVLEITEVKKADVTDLPLARGEAPPPEIKPTPNSDHAIHNENDNSGMSNSSESPATIKVTERPNPNPDAPVVKGGVPIETGASAVAGTASSVGMPRPGNSATPSASNTLPPASSAAPVRLRPAEAPATASVEEEGMFSRNLRRFVYIGFIGLIVAGGYYFTRPSRNFKTSKFAGIQPMPNPLAGTPPQPRPRVGVPTPNRVVVNRTGAPPPKRDGEQKTG